jgi:dihydrofolate synthase/folylpolyglutamate synthase
MEIRSYKDKEVILDGAHNGQKMEAFIQSLVRLYPDETFSFLISIKKGKEYESMLKPLVHHAEHIIVTSFENANQGMGNIHSEEPEIIAKHLDSLGFTNYTVIPDLSKALHTGVSQNERLIITGSLYLIGEVFQLLEK